MEENQMKHAPTSRRPVGLRPGPPAVQHREGNDGRDLVLQARWHPLEQSADITEDSLHAARRLHVARGAYPGAQQQQG